jgi:biopolymer transport protein ExbD
MAMSAGSSGGVTSDINVTPMIDVLLVLLIIFMIIQPLNRQTISIQVPPPQTNDKPTNAPNQIVLEIRDDGTYAINGQPCPKDQLDAQMRAIFDPRPVKLLFVKPGMNVIYQDVIDAMDVSRGAGVQVIGFTPADVASAGG